MTLRRAGLAGAALLLAVGCTTGSVAERVAELGRSSPAPTVTPDPSSSPVPPTSAPPRSAPAPTAAPSAAPSERRGRLSACADDDLTAMDGAVSGQLDAFAEGDYGAALEFSTEAFRAAHSEEVFEEIIAEGYPQAAMAADHELGQCLTDGDNATLAVGVIDDDGQRLELLYLMEREDDAWRIGGALPADGPSEAPTPTV
ncbi:MAG: DUF4864 domain-containing protein [Euzebyales bacterium]|nr:DUF4864 domain-containing protein [Euzebyales bacterium]